MEEIKRDKYKIVPKDTKVSKYFKIGDNIFEKMYIPDGRCLLKIVHTWEDGELMDFKFEYEDGILRDGINPLHIVNIYSYDFNIYDLPDSVVNDIKTFVDKYYKKREATFQSETPTIKEE